jgi:hypothetical protein
MIIISENFIYFPINKFVFEFSKAQYQFLIIEWIEYNQLFKKYCKNESENFFNFIKIK